MPRLPNDPLRQATGLPYRFSSFRERRRSLKISDSADLPTGFEDLTPFIGEWGMCETQDERYQQRQKLPMERLQAYYDAVTPRLEAIFDHLDRFPFDKPLPASEALLFRLVMGMSEVAQAIEMYGQPRIPHVPLGYSVQIEGLSHG